MSIRAFGWDGPQLQYPGERVNVAGLQRPAPNWRVECMAPKLKEMEVSFETPSSLFGVGLPKLSWKGKLVSSDAQQRLAWGLYVELTTRIAIAGLGVGEGSLREALSSYHSLFRFTRDRLHEVGPQVGRPQGNSEEMPIAGLVLWMLNGIIRPLLARWHPRLARHEEARPEGMGPVVHEAAWEDAEDLRRDLAAARDGLESFARLFEKVCDIRPSLIPIRAVPAQSDPKRAR